MGDPTPMADWEPAIYDVLRPRLEGLERLLTPVATGAPGEKVTLNS